MDSIVLANVTKTLKGNRVLDGVSLTLERGKVYGFFGRNASGKTMLLRAVSGLIIPDEGSVDVFGQRLHRDIEYPPDMGLVIENVGLWGDLTGLENLTLLADIRRVIGKEEIHAALGRVGLNPKDRRKYRAFSMGMKQKLALAQAIMEHPTLLILDEPTNGLDDESVGLFRTLIAEEQLKGTTCLIATHQKEDIADLCCRQFKMTDGRCDEME